MTNKATRCTLVYKNDDGSITFELSNLVFVEGEYDLIAFSCNVLEEEAIKHISNTFLYEKLSDTYMYVSGRLAKAIKNANGSYFEYFKDSYAMSSCIRVTDIKVLYEDLNNTEDFTFEGLLKICQLTTNGQLSLLFPRLTQEMIESFEEL